jgi:hypothetical protein
MSVTLAYCVYFCSFLCLSYVSNHHFFHSRVCEYTYSTLHFHSRPRTAHHATGSSQQRRAIGPHHTRGAHAGTPGDKTVVGRRNTVSNVITQRIVWGAGV